MHHSSDIQKQHDIDQDENRCRERQQGQDRWGHQNQDNGPSQHQIQETNQHELQYHHQNLDQDQLQYRYQGQDENSRCREDTQRQLPAWLDHFNPRDLKTLFRCWAATWTATIIIFIRPALLNIGVATFFGALLLYIVPPASILLVYLLASFSLLLGMCLAWAWGLLALKAALAARPFPETQARLHGLKQEASSQAQRSGDSVAIETQRLVHDGFMLDARVTVVMYVMCCAFVYTLARLRCSNSKLVLMQLFGTIVTDLFLLFGPTVPDFNASLASVLVKPGAVGIGLGLACCLILFPQSTSYVVLNRMEILVLMAGTPLDWTRKRLTNEPMRLDQLRASKDQMITTYREMEPALAFLPLDFSRGRWSAEDVAAQQGVVRKVVLTSIALLELDIAIISATDSRARRVPEKQEPARDASAGHERKRTGQQEQTQDLVEAIKTPEQGTMRPRALQALRENTAPVLEVCSLSIRLAARAIHSVNTHRWIGILPQQAFDELAEQLQEARATLQSARATSAADLTQGVLTSHADLFDRNGQLKASVEMLQLRGIVISMVVEEHILATAMAVDEMLAHTLHLISTRKLHRIWIPSRLQYAVSWLLSAGSSISVSSKGTDAGDDPDVTSSSTKALEEPSSSILTEADVVSGGSSVTEAASNSQGPHGIRRATGGAYAVRKLGLCGDGESEKKGVSRRVVQWLFGPAGMYSLRMVVVTIVTALPASFSHSAGFFYREKGIWGVITAQTTLPVYTADLTLSVVSRLLGTLIGGVMGLVAWYVGSGGGSGNPYGMAAITGLMTVVLVWWRVFLPPSFDMASIMCGATFVLVVGFSYDEHHIQQDGLPGQGYQAFWKRVVTVLLGFVASIVVQTLPRPPSARRHIRKTLANSVGMLSDHYREFLSHWGSNVGGLSIEKTEYISLKVAEVLLSLEPRIRLLKVEPSIVEGAWQPGVLAEMQQQCQYMNQSLTKLLRLSTSLEAEMQQRLVLTMGILNDGVMEDVMDSLGSIARALKTGSPLPKTLRVLFETALDSCSRWDSGYRLNTRLVQDESYRKYCVALSSYLKFLGAIDDLMRALREVVGESRNIVQEV